MFQTFNIKFGSFINSILWIPNTSEHDDDLFKYQTIESNIEIIKVK